ncbi:MAG: hypothetical protein V2A73_08715 [Pseudomonadota bacterium]
MIDPGSVRGLCLPTAPRLSESSLCWWIVGLDAVNELRSIRLDSYTDEARPPIPPILARISEQAAASGWAWPFWPAITFARTQQEAERQYLALLARELRRRQLAEGVTDKEFAAQLGISRALWNLIRRGRQPLTVATLHGALAAYPDLATATLAYLREQEREVRA